MLFVTPSDLSLVLGVSGAVVVAGITVVVVCTLIAVGNGVRGVSVVVVGYGAVVFYCLYC